MSTGYHVQWIDPPGRPINVYSFYVTGYGQFPWELLAFSCCWPASKIDANKLELSHKHRSILLVSYRKPDTELWKKHRWCVGITDLRT